MLRRAVATRGRVLLVAVCLAVPLACKSSNDPTPQPPSTGDAGEPGDEPGAGGTDASGGGMSAGGKSNGGGTTGVVGGEPGIGAGGAPTEPGSWDEATWDEALWQ